MDVLQIFRTEPDENVKTLSQAFDDLETKEVTLYKGDPDYETLVEDIFKADKVISWW
jgi:hypothetical protein